MRTYRVKTAEEIQAKMEEKGEEYKIYESGWRFSQYEANYNQGRPYINYLDNIEQGDCQLYACIDRYVYEGFTNPKQRMWLSYRF